MALLFRILLLSFLLFLIAESKKHHHHRRKDVKMKHHQKKKDIKLNLKDTEEEKNKPYNVLLLISDDMRAEATPFDDEANRPWLYSNIHTPNLARLSTKSVVFEKAYTQAPRCNPSRSSFLTGRRPDSTRVFNNHAFFRNTSRSHLTTMPEFFRSKGYDTIGIGKVFHAEYNAMEDNEYSWTQDALPYTDGINKRHAHSWYVVSDDEAERSPFGDIVSKNYAVAHLDEFAENYHENGKNFFLAVGFKRPHLPYTVPNRYIDQYNLDDIPLPRFPHPASYNSEINWPGAGELPHYGDIQKYFKVGEYHLDNAFPDDITKELRRAYYGCVTFMDDMVGDVLRKVDENKLWDNTVIVFMSDHGYHLGESGVWGKNTIWEEALHVPLMVKVPGLHNTERINELVELVDVYPTIVEAAGLGSMEVCHHDNKESSFCSEGSSLMPFVRGEDPEWKDAAFSQSIFPLYSEPIEYSGYTVRTKEYRYTEWIKFTNGESFDWDNVIIGELFDLRDDPYEMTNMYWDSKYTSTRQRLAEKLHAGWEAAHPEIRE